MKLQKYISKTLDVLIVLVMLLFFASFGFRDGRSSGWYQQWFPNLNGSTIISMSFLDSLTGYAATNTNSLVQGYILKTTNGGDNWNIIFTYDSLPYNNITFTSLKFVNKNIGYVGTNYYDLFKTTNGGINWLKLYISFGCSDMSAINKDTVLIVQNDIIDGGVYRTTNGGLSWQALGPTGGSGQPGSIYMFDKNMGFCLGNQMRKTTNGGVNWFVIPGESYSGIQFIDSLKGWKTAGSGIKISTNGGLNWNSQQLPNLNHSYHNTNLFAINNDIVWMIGNEFYFGLLYKTTNGGVNWGYQFADTSIHMTLDHFINFVNAKTGWASSSYFVSVIHTKVGGNDTTYFTSVNSNLSEIPENFILKQNYPNPFNPKTHIKYEITKEVKNQKSEIRMQVYDISGKQIAVLVKERKGVGEYEVIFNAKGLPSGLYFYSLFADGVKIDTKKMIFLK